MWRKVSAMYSCDDMIHCFKEGRESVKKRVPAALFCTNWRNWHICMASTAHEKTFLASTGTGWASYCRWALWHCTRGKYHSHCQNRSVGKSTIQAAALFMKQLTKILENNHYNGYCTQYKITRQRHVSIEQHLEDIISFLHMTHLLSAFFKKTKLVFSLSCCEIVCQGSTPIP